MEETIANVQCEACGEWFDVPARNYEKVIQEEQPVLCNSCFDSAMEEAEALATPERVGFEYMIAPTGSWSESDTDDEIKAFNLYGQDGWELIQITNQKAYFKRLYVEGLS